MDLLAERGRRVTVDELNTTRLLAHARKQAVQRNLVAAKRCTSTRFSRVMSFALLAV